MKKRFYLFAFLFVSVCGNLFAQDFFADEVVDTIPKKFYEQERRVSVLYAIGYPNDYVGFTVVIHNNKEKFSFYIAGRTNIWESYWIDGFSKDSTSRVHQQSSYCQSSLTFGLGGAVRPNLLLYAAFGTTYRFSSLNKDMYRDREIFFTPTKTGYSLACDAGLLYVTPIGVSFQLGADVFNKKLVVGLGYTF